MCLFPPNTTNRIANIWISSHFSREWIRNKHPFWGYPIDVSKNELMHPWVSVLKHRTMLTFKITIKDDSIGVQDLEFADRVQIENVDYLKCLNKTDRSYKVFFVTYHEQTDYKWLSTIKRHFNRERVRPEKGRSHFWHVPNQSMIFKDKSHANQYEWNFLFFE